MTKKNIKLKKYLGWTVAIAGTTAVFLFFQGFYSYHLFHREQTSLFLYTKEALSGYFSEAGCLSHLLGDFFTQFFYLIGGGATIIALSLFLLGLVGYYAARTFFRQEIALSLAVLLCLWEGSRECLNEYTLASTYALLGGIACYLLHGTLRRSLYGALLSILLCLVGGYWCFGYGVWVALGLICLREVCDKGRRWPVVSVAGLAMLVSFFLKQPEKVNWWGTPDFRLEHLMAIDTQAYFGQWKEVARLTEEDRQSNVGTYYYNLANALQGNLPDKLMDYYQPFDKGLFLPVDPTGNYFSFMAAGEVWYQLGDMTMAEHSTILSMIFSKGHTGSRMLKRLAEINLINGDDEAAMKYLRMLQKSWKHKRWAELRMPGRQSEAVRQWLANKRLLVSTSDTLRASGDVRLSLRHLLANHPENEMAYHYLLCYDLLTKNIAAFVEDYVPERSAPCRLYGEAILIYLAAHKDHLSIEEVQRYHLSPALLEEFKAYTQLYEQNNGNGSVLRLKYGNSYWFYFHFAQMKQ